MPKLPVLKLRQVIAALEKAGFRQVRQKGSHLQFKRGSSPWGFESTCVEIHFTAVANEQ